MLKAILSSSNNDRERCKFTRINSRCSPLNKLNIALGLINLSCCLGISSVLATRAVGAEKIYLDYGALEFSVSVDALETYATEGKIEGALSNYTDFFSEEQLEQLRVGLTTSADLSPLAIAQFLYSYQGEKILERVGKVIQTTARQPGFHALRSALILAAADEEAGGLTPLNVLKKFPTKSIRIDSARGLEIIDNLSNVVRRNNQAISAVERAAAVESSNSPSTVKARSVNLLEPGSFSYRQQLLTMRDPSRDRKFPVDLYLPQLQSDRLLPLAIISHGLGSDRTTFEYFAGHLASHGFAVAVPEHPGSNASQIQAMLSGFANDVTPPEELVDRPLDIKFLLDELSKDYGQQLDTQNVGIIGQSFGAYTALALAGAELNFPELEASCSDLDDSWNLSLLLQCLALELPYEPFELQDDRIAAAIAINPLVSAVFGKDSLSEINIPVMLVSGSADPVTPALPEQIQPFTWLKSENKYLVLLKGGTHFSTLNESAGSIPVPVQAIGPEPQIAQRYIKQLGLAFFETYIARNSSYQAYLRADYANQISNSQIPLSLVRSLDEVTLELKQ